MKTWQENSGGTTNGSKLNYKCQYCNKLFRKESVLAAHQCEPKRRALQEKEQGVQLGLRAWLRFYEITQGSARTKSYVDFAASQFYSAFVKFGRHLVAIRAVNPAAFIEYVIRQNKKLDYWTHDAIYVEYLRQYLRRESAQDALERSLVEMQEYTDESQQFNNFNEYFKQGNANRICQHITNGRVSPWVVYNCSTGIEFLEQLNEEQIAMILPWIDPDHWQAKFKDYVADTEWVKMILKTAGL